MSIIAKKIHILSLSSFALLLAAMGVVSIESSTATMFAVSLAMFLTCSLSAMHLFGVRTAVKLIVLAILVGFFAEYMGENYGWFFGDYDFTDALGFRLLGVPVVIPLMWFNLSYICFILANIILHRAPMPPCGSAAGLIAASVFGAMLVTAYDLGADPYMVFVAKAWIMQKTDGWWFGETLQGFVGWLTISFVIILCFNLITKAAGARPLAPFRKLHALMPILIYLNLMAFQMLYGHPVETRTIAFFAMGIPLMAALFSFAGWSWDESTGTTPA